jgi:capping protein beta
MPTRVSGYRGSGTEFHHKTVCSKVKLGTMGALLDGTLDLIPPQNVEDNITSLISISPDYADDHLGSVNQPLKLMTNRTTGKDYLACDYSQDGDSYKYMTMMVKYPATRDNALLPRSLWSNEYNPPLDDGTVPSSKLRS